MKETKAQKNCIAIGGVGGSGTRIVAELCIQSGYHLGSNLNSSNDNLSFPSIRDLVFYSKREQIERDKLVKQQINKFIGFIKSELSNVKDGCGWGWKVPGSFFYLNYFNMIIPEFKYIHVIRNGMNMAFSSNQNQLKNFGPIFNIEYTKNTIYRDSLQYWIEANNIAINFGQENMKERFYILEFEKLCINPKIEIGKLFEFLSIDKCTKFIDDMALLIHRPNSLNRHLSQDCESIFTPKQFKGLNNIYKQIEQFGDENE